MTSAIPPRIAAEATNNRSVTDSPRNTTPPTAAKTRTLSCTMAALVAFRIDPPAPSRREHGLTSTTV
jgi:hypothetical protein